MENNNRTIGDRLLKLWICTLVVALINTQVNSESINVTHLQSAVSKGAVCLDGSAPRYAFHQGHGSGADNWLIFIEGGGWCNSTADCLTRTAMARSGNVHYRSRFDFSGLLDTDQAFNPDFYNWNKAYLVYCDAASFMADVEEVDPTTNLTFRGARIFDAIMEEFLAMGMKNAKNAILSGTSAGGLATILHCDKFRGLIPNANRVKCISDSGFFIHAKNLPGAQTIREQRFADVIAIHKLRERLPKSCTSKVDPNLCLFPEYLVDDVQTPLFLLESAFDKYQITQNYIRSLEGPLDWSNCTANATLCTSTEVKLMQDFRNAFLETLHKLDNNPSRGILVHSCFRHGNLGRDEWGCKSTLQNNAVTNKTIGEAITDWYFDRSSFQVIDTQNEVPRECNCTVPSISAQ